MSDHNHHSRPDLNQVGEPTATEGRCGTRRPAGKAEGGPASPAARISAPEEAPWGADELPGAPDGGGRGAHADMGAAPSPQAEAGSKAQRLTARETASLEEQRCLPAGLPPGGPEPMHTDPDLARLCADAVDRWGDRRAA